ncbi:Opi1-domain-containing protein [Punctularia strigosozonata HHB-11173 SS5]|uniref:Opi1-domain-containing protein n=1 Tax=Punctularia strigosozonata (strain HHB-11173) TaxID=741275 RepID=UPI000441689B|nr:Opi1-domain-containing protein [Punctularia strigosozonata HHB-11173 SS5]EIN09478.1 Opi1-domain-containing protein [Punctularia strigosozonata HHB-11173 SS5]
MSLDDADESVRIAVRALGDMRTRGATRSVDGKPSTREAEHDASSSFSSPTASSLPTPLQSSNTYIFDQAAASNISLDYTPDRPMHQTPSNGHGQNADYLARVSSIPIVNSALRAYEHGKASSRIVNYGAGIVESSISTISRPVINRLGYSRRASSSQEQRPTLDHQSSSRNDERELSVERGGDATVERGSKGPDREEGLGLHIASGQDDASASHQMQSLSTDSASPTASPSEANGSREVAPRPLWHTVLLEAGGIGTAVTVSDDNLRRLRYALSWLGYATAHIDAQILVLREFMASLQNRVGGNETVSPEHMRTLNSVKRDLVSTIRQAVDVVSKYGGGALPEPARSRVRGFILTLPQRWARAAGGSGGPATSRPARHGVHPHGHEVSGSSKTSPPTSRSTAHAARHGLTTPYSRPTSPTSTAPSSPLHSRVSSATDLTSMNRGVGQMQMPSLEVLAEAASSSTPGAGPSRLAGSADGATEGREGGEGSFAAVPVSQATHAAQKILSLATESLDMMRSVTGVVKDSLDKADTWIERMRAVGIQRQQPGQGTQEANHPDDMPPIPGSGASMHLPPLDAIHLAGTQPSMMNQGDVLHHLPVDEVERLSELRIRSATVTPRMASGSLPDIAERAREGDAMDEDGNAKAEGGG